MIGISGELRVDASREALWEVLDEPARLAEALPGVDEVCVLGSEEFSARIHPEASTGPMPFQMTFGLRDRVRPERMTIDGRAVQAERAVELSAALELSPDDGATVVDWRMSARFLGPLGAVGQRVLPDIVRAEVQRALQAAAALAADGA